MFVEIGTVFGAVVAVLAVIRFSPFIPVQMFAGFQVHVPIEPSRGVEITLRAVVGVLFRLHVYHKELPCL